MSIYDTPEDVSSDTTVDEPLAECDVCGCTGVAERVDPENHDCSEFLNRRELEASATSPAEVRTDGGRPLIDLDTLRPEALDGGTVLFAESIDGEIPIALIGTYSRTDVRAALGRRGFAGHQIDRAERVEWPTEQQAALVGQAESNEATSQ